MVFVIVIQCLSLLFRMYFVKMSDNSPDKRWMGEWKNVEIWVISYINMRSMGFGWLGSEKTVFC